MRRISLALALASVSFALFLAPGTSPAGTLSVASWNINNLNHKTGQPLRGNAPARTERDYELLNHYRALLDADVVALQEMGSPQAAARVFPQDEYTILFSSRYNTRPGEHRRKRDVFTALAVRKTVTILERQDLEALEFTHPDGHSSYTRYGVSALLEKDGRRFRVLALHLKSGCAKGSLQNPTDEDCEILARQIPPLEHWIEEHHAQGIPLILMGDFNRRFDAHGPRDHLWADLDDDNPKDLDLKRLPFHQASQCPSHQGDDPIDFLIFDSNSWPLVNTSSFQELLYTPADATHGDALSDHCPIKVQLHW